MMRIFPTIIFSIIILNLVKPVYAQQNADTSYHDNGQIRSIGVSIDGKKQGRWIWQHYNGNVCAKEKYENDKLVKAKYWDKFGKKSDNSEVRTDPLYPGGFYAFREMIESNLIYPENLAEIGKQGRSIVTFTINEEGRVVDPIIVKTSHVNFDKEALRVVLLSELWEPGTFHGEIAPTIMVMPINFNLKK